VTFKPGQSGNPAGRKPGVIDRRQRIAQFFEGDGVEIAKVVIDAAKKGDMQAAALILNRVAPPARARAERVNFSLDTSQPLAAQAAAVVQSIADGLLAPDEAQAVLACLSTYASLVQADQLDARLKELERRAGVEERLERRPGNMVIDESPLVLAVPGAIACDARQALPT
jgi:hypothetical protein